MTVGFFTLPREVRDLIYTEAIIAGPPKMDYPTSKVGQVNTLRQVCRQCRNEIDDLPISHCRQIEERFGRENTFSLIFPLQLLPATDILESVGRILITHCDSRFQLASFSAGTGANSHVLLTPPTHVRGMEAIFPYEESSRIERKYDKAVSIPVELMPMGQPLSDCFARFEITRTMFEDESGQVSEQKLEARDSCSGEWRCDYKVDSRGIDAPACLEKHHYEFVVRILAARIKRGLERAAS